MRLARYGESGNKTYVCEIVPESPAQESRQISLNDVVTHVDGQGEEGGGGRGREQAGRPGVGGGVWAGGRVGAWVVKGERGEHQQPCCSFH